ncbi:hypothetical protein JEY39_06165 [Pseudomonas aeruginosa]|nr:hypothetical protein [Pseudomonas aeruginosa]
MTESKICTCPSGDGSLRWPCPAHPAVDQADVAAKLTFINGRPAMCGCQVEYSDGGGEYSDVIYVTLCAKHSGSAILDLVATNRIALTPEYEGQWHADLYMDREIPLAKVEGATPAEAVLALMSAERIDPEQESVEEAGGDERAAFNRWIAEQQLCQGSDISLFKLERNGALVSLHELLRDAYQAGQDRAALAQPSPALAEAERPEVVGYRSKESGMVYEQDYGLKNPEALTTVAECERIVGALRADRDSWAEQAEQRLADWDEMRKERDAALVRVEQQERTIAGMNEAHATLAGLYEAAQAQHSVPGDIMRDAQRYRWLRDQQFYFSFSTENSDAGISSCTAGMSSRFKNLSWVDAAIDSAIAAAPGKEGV